jgi:hypothetical protein
LAVLASNYDNELRKIKIVVREKLIIFGNYLKFLILKIRIFDGMDSQVSRDFKRFFEFEFVKSYRKFLIENSTVNL